MRLASLAGGLLVALGGIAHAAEGDDLVVTGDGVNVRAQPQSGAPVLLQVHRPEPAVEVAREGEWVRVRLPAHDTVGWIHGSLLAAAEGAPPGADGDPTAAPPAAVQAAETAASGAANATAPPAPDRPAETTASGGVDGAAVEPAQPGGPQVAAVGAPTTDALARFRASVDSLNNRALAAAGVSLFADVRMAGEDIAQVIATEAWDTVPEGGRQSYLNVLHDRWLDTVGSPLASLQVVDQSGRVLSERAAP